MFNDPTFRSELLRRTNQQIEVYAELAPPESRQPDGTMSCIYDWYEYVPELNRGRLLATVHVFKRPDGTLGGCGEPDPKVFVRDGIPHVDP